jgi:hypothetical protein
LGFKKNCGIENVLIFENRLCVCSDIPLAGLSFNCNVDK